MLRTRAAEAFSNIAIAARYALRSFEHNAVNQTHRTLTGELP